MAIRIGDAEISRAEEFTLQFPIKRLTRDQSMSGSVASAARVVAWLGAAASISVALGCDSSTPLRCRAASSPAARPRASRVGSTLTVTGYVGTVVIVVSLRFSARKGSGSLETRCVMRRRFVALGIRVVAPGL